MKSIIQTEKECFICGSQRWLEEHHVFSGGCRKLSERYGLKVWLCHYCHNEKPNGVHHNATINQHLKRIVQEVAMKHYGWTINDFRNIFSKSYL